VTAVVAADVLPLDRAVIADRDTAEERALVEAARAGDRDAFGALVTRHERAVLRTAMAALGDRADAEDAAQDACILAWQKLSGFRGEAMFRTWLLAIVWRKALDRRRRRRATWWSASTAAGRSDGDLDWLSATGADPERETVSRDLARRVESEIRHLSPKLRDALLLAASGEHSYAEIAAILGIPLGTLKWRVSEARRVIGQRVS
jgi:RNA polymerase sigma-70 factor (ECF subfamily)